MRFLLLVALSLSACVTSQPQATKEQITPAQKRQAEEIYNFCVSQMTDYVGVDIDECYSAWLDNSTCLERFPNGSEDQSQCTSKAIHPIEAKCESAAEKHGGYWECVRLGHERRERRIQAQSGQQAASRAAEQADLKAEREQSSAVWEAVGTAFGGHKANKTKCVSKHTYRGYETECE